MGHSPISTVCGALSPRVWGRGCASRSTSRFQIPLSRRSPNPPSQPSRKRSCGLSPTKPTGASGTDGMVSLSGTLICASEEQLRAVLDHLPEHMMLTRREPGCLYFEVVQRSDEPMVWDVEERFV